MKKLATGIIVLAAGFVMAAPSADALVCKSKTFGAAAKHRNQAIAKTMVAKKLYAQAKKWCPAKTCKLYPAKNQIIKCRKMRGGWYCKGTQSFRCCCIVCKSRSFRAKARHRIQRVAYNKVASTINRLARGWCKKGKLSPYRNRVIKCRRIPGLKPIGKGTKGLKPIGSAMLKPIGYECAGGQTFKCCW